MKPTSEELRELIAEHKEAIFALQRLGVSVKAYHSFIVPNGLDIGVELEAAERSLIRVLEYYTVRLREEKDRRSARISNRGTPPELMANLKIGVKSNDAPPKVLGVVN